MTEPPQEPNELTLFMADVVDAAAIANGWDGWCPRGG